MGVNTETSLIMKPFIIWMTTYLYSKPGSTLHIFYQGSRLIHPTGRAFATNFLSWPHKHIIWSIFFFETTFD